MSTCKVISRNLKAGTAMVVIVSKDADGKKTSRTSHLTSQKGVSTEMIEATHSKS